jgi:outer membrane receptor protein involved in Fe transport
MFQFSSPTAAQGAPVNANTYTATEKIFSYYTQAKIVLFKRYEILGGLRVENTQQGWKTVVDPSVLAGAYGLATYTDYLPSINFKYLLTEKQNVRLSYYAAVNRPGFSEYIPFRMHTDTYDEIGNPLLKHATSNNYDIRYEYFPKGLDQLLIGAFYKNITNPIETAVAYGVGGGAAASIQPQNVGTATNYGFEIALTKYFGKFGLSGNYTYTHSAITTLKEYWYLDSNQNATHTAVNQTRPLQGQSPHIANLSALYKNKNWVWIFNWHLFIPAGK